jgi:hypothetical protein
VPSPLCYSPVYLSENAMVIIRTNKIVSFIS